MEAKVIQGRFASGQLVRIAARADLPSRFGDFEIVAFDSVDGKEHVAILKGEGPRCSACACDLERSAGAHSDRFSDEFESFARTLVSVESLGGGAAQRTGERR